jgi:hypothetical protein
MMMTFILVSIVSFGIVGLIFFKRVKIKFLLFLVDKKIASGNFDEVIQLLESAVIISKGISNNEVRSEALAEIAVRQACDSTIESAISTTNYIESPEIRSEALSKIAKKQAASGDIAGAKTTIEVAVSVAKGIDDKEVSSKALSIIASNLGKIAEKQAASGDIAGVKTTIEVAVSVAKGIDDKEVSSKALSIIASNLGKIAEKQAASGDPERSKITFKLAISTAEKIKNKSKLSTALSEIVKRQLIVVSNLLDAAVTQATSGDPERSKTTFESAVKIVEDIKNNSTCSRALSEIAAKQAGSTIFKLLILETIHIEDNSDRSKYLSRISSKQSSSGDMDGSKTTFKAAVQVALGIKYEWSRMEALAEIAVRQACDSTIESAISTTNYIESPEIRSEALSKIAKKQAIFGDLEGARKTYKVAVRAALKSIRPYPLSRIAEKQASSDLEGASKTLKTASKRVVGHYTAYSIDGYNVSLELALTQALCGDILSAYSTIKSSIQDSEFGIFGFSWHNTLGILSQKEKVASEKVSNGDIDGARTDFLQVVVQVSREIDGEDPRSQALLIIADNQAISGDTCSANDTIRYAIQTLIPIWDEWSRRYLLDIFYKQTAIAEKLATSGDIAGARNIVDTDYHFIMERLKSKRRNDLLSIIADQKASVAKILILCNDIAGAMVIYQAAMRVAREINYRDARLDTIGEILLLMGEVAVEQALSGDIFGANTTLEKTIQVAKIRFGSVSSYKLLGFIKKQLKLAEIQALCGEMTSSKATSKAALLVAQSLEEHYSSEAMSEITKIQALISKLEITRTNSNEGTPVASNLGNSSGQISKRYITQKSKTSELQDKDLFQGETDIYQDIISESAFGETDLTEI